MNTYSVHVLIDGYWLSTGPINKALSYQIYDSYLENRANVKLLKGDQQIASVTVNGRNFDSRKKELI